jgi:hypothetical protein
MQILPNAKAQFIDSAGQPLSSGSVGFYFPGTLNPKATFQDSAGTIANTNPVQLDSRGQALIWGSGVYRQIVKDASGVTIWDQVTEDANAGLTGNITDANFIAGTDFTPGTTAQLTLPAAPGSVTNMWIFFDAAFQGDDQIASLDGLVLTFNSPIPVGVQEVNIKIGSTIAVGTPGAGTVSDSSVVVGSKLFNRITDWVDVKDCGAKGDGIADDTTAIVTAIAKQAAAGGGIVYFPVGTFLISSPINLPQNVTLAGNYTGSVIRAKTAVTSMFVVQGGAVTIRDLLLDGNNYAAATAVTNSGKDFFTLEHCLIQTAGNGYIHADAGASIPSQSPIIRQNLFINNTTNITFMGGCVNMIIDQNYIFGGTGVIMNQTTTHCEGLYMSQNLVLPTTLNGSAGIGLVINAGLEFLITNNIIDQCIQNAVVLAGLTGASSSNYMKFLDNWFGFSTAPAANGIGVVVLGNVSNAIFRGNTFAVSPTWGFQAQDQATFIPGNILLDGNLFLNNVTGDVVINSTAGEYIVKNNLFNRTTNALIDANNNIAGTVSGNFFPGGKASTAFSTARKIGLNDGVTTQTLGTATIPSGSTSITVDHLCDLVPVAGNVTVNITNIASNPVGEVSVAVIGATQLTFTCRNNPGASGLNLAWEVNCTGFV